MLSFSDKKDTIGKYYPDYPLRRMRMLVTGKPVTVEQAKDITFRTSCALTGRTLYRSGNLPEGYVRFKEKSKLNKLLKEIGRFNKEIDDLDDSEVEEELAGFSRFINLDPLIPKWVESCEDTKRNIWCRTNGTIYGKWEGVALPNIYDILLVWEEAAAHFPYLDMNVTLFTDGRGDDSRRSAREMLPDNTPFINIRVKNGEANPCAPDTSVHIIPKKKPTYGKGLPLGWYAEFAKRLRPEVEGCIDNLDLEPEEDDGEFRGFKLPSGYEV